jgi:hypothetical protein
MINHSTTDFLEAYIFNTLLMDFVDGEPRFFLKRLAIMKVHRKYSSSRVTNNNKSLKAFLIDNVG